MLPGRVAGATAMLPFTAAACLSRPEQSTSPESWTQVVTALTYAEAPRKWRPDDQEYTCISYMPNTPVTSLKDHR